MMDYDLWWITVKNHSVTNAIQLKLKLKYIIFSVTSCNIFCEFHVMYF